MGRNQRKFNALDIVLVGMFAALMAIGANVTSFIVIGGVPVTLQPFFATLAGALLGSRLGPVSMIVYTLIGLAGAPVFAGFRGGFSILTSPTFGFILSFIIIAYVIGKMVESKEQPTKMTFFIAAFIGLAINYILGTNYMYFAYQFLASLENMPYGVVWGWMAAPFVKDFILTIFVAMIAPRIYAVIRKSSLHTNPATKKVS
ncbi:biotin transporter BioY [Desertibacillus haloalkaliphilus]|uniref:biotin transporter BioY n=1 Tax=Desertibacillus haloalkaliphilus TaxID=1328930 RepID=UPI001C27937C|nr:biotin transporter BioY [Desertibacillus haloalkaliphilus]MBU8905369.1 biotin transporter BioY [Desertibacillus haloalkaliphilus]